MTPELWLEAERWLWGVNLAPDRRGARRYALLEGREVPPLDYYDVLVNAARARGYSAEGVKL